MLKLLFPSTLALVKLQALPSVISDRSSGCVPSHARICSIGVPDPDVMLQMGLENPQPGRGGGGG